MVGVCKTMHCTAETVQRTLWKRGACWLAIAPLTLSTYSNSGCPSDNRARQAGLDYSQLKGLLADGDFQAADDETRDLLIRLAGPEAVKRKWVYFTEVCSHRRTWFVLSSCALYP